MQDIIIKLIADGAVIPLVLVAAWALIMKVPRGQHYKAYSRILLAGLTTYVLAKLIGSIYQPELQRPFQMMGVEARASFLDNPGFPSDHVLFCAAITLAVWFETRKRGIVILLAILTATVAIGRMLALVHSPLDVIGAVLIALIGAVWYLQRQPNTTIKPSKQWSKPKKAVKIS